jgi:hypothetical protein
MLHPLILNKSKGKKSRIVSGAALLIRDEIMCEDQGPFLSLLRYFATY